MGGDPSTSALVILLELATNHAKMARRTFASGAMEMSAIGPNDKSTAEDFDRRLLFLYRTLRVLSWDSVLPCHLQLAYIRVRYRHDDKAEPEPVTPQALDDAIQRCKWLLMKPRDFGGAPRRKRALPPAHGRTA